MAKSLKQIWTEIRQGENIDLYLTLIIAFVLASLNVFGIGGSLTGPITLAVLALLAFSSLVNRRKLEEAVEKISRDREVLMKSFPANRDMDIEGAKELWLVGLTLAKTIENYYAKLREKLKQGDHIRVLIVAPDGDCNELIAQRKFSPTTPHQIQAKQRATLELLCHLKKDYTQNIEIRTMKFPTFIGVVAADLEVIEGVIYVEHYSYNTSPEDLPKLVFRQSDTRWFGYYRQQIMNMWNDGDEWKCPQTEEVS
jgi:hypothetical protein